MNTWIRACVRDMKGYVPGEQPALPGLVKLNTNENPYPPSPAVARALREFDPDRLRLYPDPTCRRLRERIAALHGCGPESVFVGNGSDEVLASCVRAFVEPDGTVGYFDPSYSLYPVLAEAEGVARRPVALGPDYRGGLPADYRCSLFFLTNPNAPTGMTHAGDVVDDACRRPGGVVVIDEAYVDFADADCLDRALGLPNVLVARTLSKSFSLAGLRFGYAVGAPDLVAAMDKIKDSYNVDAVAQALALAALEDIPHMRANVARVRATRGRTAAALSALGFLVFPSETNFLWTRPPRIAAGVYAHRLRERSILVRYFAGERTGDCVRITIGTDEQMSALLRATREILDGDQPG